MYVVFDLETTGLLQSNPYIVSIALKVFSTDTDALVYTYYQVVEPPNEQYEFPVESVRVHGITTDYARIHGISIHEVIRSLHIVFDTYDIETAIAHNIKFDISVLGLQLDRFDEGDHDGVLLKDKIRDIQTFCTMMAGINLTNLMRTSRYGRSFKKQPKLIELYDHLFPGETFNAHNANDDVDACARCYIEMKKKGLLYM